MYFPSTDGGQTERGWADYVFFFSFFFFSWRAKILSSKKMLLNDRWPFCDYDIDTCVVGYLVQFVLYLCTTYTHTYLNGSGREKEREREGERERESFILTARYVSMYMYIVTKYIRV